MAEQPNHPQISSTSSKMRSSFPLIPPLPSSKKKQVVDKENTDVTPFRLKTNEVRSSNQRHTTAKRTSLSSARNISSNSSGLPFRESTNGNMKANVNRSPNVLGSTHKRDRVLRTAESMESLFMLSAGNSSTISSPSHVQLCQEIVNGSRSDDAAAWWRVLEVACQQVERNEKQQHEGSSTAKSDLMRLHRRAKARFSLFEGSSWMNGHDTNNGGENDVENYVVAIWLSYAEMQDKYTSPEEARATYRFMQNQYPNVQRMASFYLSLAKLESTKPARAMEILTSGLQKHAKPSEDLRAALSALKGGSSSIFRTPKHPPNATTQASPLLHPEQRAAAMNPKIATVGRKRAAPVSTISPQQQRKVVVVQMQKSVEFEQSSSAMDDSNMSTGTISLSLENVSDVNNSKLEQEEPVRPSLAQRKAGTSTNGKKSSFLNQNDDKQIEASSTSKHASLRVERKTKSRMSAVSSKTRQRSSLLAKVPRLKSAGLTGGAKRLSPEENNNALSDSDDDGDFNQLIKSKKKETKVLKAAPAPVPKLTKVDLSYMLNWDPTKRGSQQGPGETSTMNNEDPGSKSRGPSMEPVVEGSELASSKYGASFVTTTSHANSTGSSHTGRSDLSNESDYTGKHTNSHTNANSEVTTVPQEASKLAQCNLEFLPLVNENNIIRVNDIPYVKLGMIGKGGSSKVYRALSRSCSVLAIKKVKFGHLDKKAIDGYANEIALLKKLQGNPAIIQMYDSQVDMKRKAIFLAMEVGEVDLSQVVQQQALQSSDSQQSLNMNFIRLTWQQMLSAVHSIHEERIIHGDLKPANFLFVRGALKLIDFGIAKAIQSDDTNNIYRDSQIGTLNYMSPEAILDTGSGADGARMRIGRASDIWSLGCILYQMVYGRTPFASLHMIQKLQAIVNPAHKIDFPASVDDAAVDAIQRCLRRTADQRPPIVGKGGLLNEHYFLNYHRTSTS